MIIVLLDSAPLSAASMGQREKTVGDFNNTVQYIFDRIDTSRLGSCGGCTEGCDPIVLTGLTVDLCDARCETRVRIGGGNEPKRRRLKVPAGGQISVTDLPDWRRVGPCPLSGAKRDIRGRAASASSVAIDPKRTLGPIQNNSDMCCGAVPPKDQ